MTKQEGGFTLIELLMAMAVFSFMMGIVVAGFINVIRLHDEAVAANQSQDGARAAMDTVVQAVRDASSQQLQQTFAAVGAGVPVHTLCLISTEGQEYFYVNAVNKTLYESDDCVTHANPLPLTADNLEVSNFAATLETEGLTDAGIPVDPEVQIDLTVASNNGTTNPAGTACIANAAAQRFCSVISLTSGAVPRE